MDAEMELIKFSIADVITTSPETSETTDPTEDNNEVFNVNNGPMDPDAFTTQIPGGL